MCVCVCVCVCVCCVPLSSQLAAVGCCLYSKAARINMQRNY